MRGYLVFGRPRVKRGKLVSEQASTAVTRVKDMAADDLRDQIAQLETEIEQLADTVEKCRKVTMFSKVIIGAGAIWMLAYVLGAIRFEPTTMVGAIAAVIGGVVLYGSNASTSKAAMMAMNEAETLRAALIDMVDPQTVGRSTQLIS